MIKTVHCAAITNIDREARQITHLISDDSMDRNGNMIEQSGWLLDNYRRNPIVVADHDHSLRGIIGTSIAQKKTPEGLLATTQFPPTGLGADAFELIAHEPPLLRAWSVGWLSAKGHRTGVGAEAGCKRCEAAMEALGEEAEYGRHHLQSELLEYSAVAIPANANIVSASLVEDGLITTLGAEKLFAKAEEEEPEVDDNDPAPNVNAPSPVAGRPRNRSSVYDAIVEANRRMRQLHNAHQIREDLKRRQNS